ncbi:MAG: tRNA lysidine(34) synthetase TilS [Flavobacteriales bacterium]
MKNRHQHIVEEVKNQLLFAENSKIMVACSGGKDSIALCHILLKLEKSFSIAHVNFELRGEESDGDELFVREFAERHSLPFFVFKPEQSDLVREENEGVQEWARRARYRWFERILNQEQYDYMLVAHHQQDQAETILHQFFRGGGLASLSGMGVKNGQILRPMLHIGKDEIDAFVTAENIKWREDSSNDTNDYTRNFLRHELLPLLREINPDISNSLDRRASWFREADLLMNKMLESEIDVHVEKSSGKWILPLGWIGNFAAPHHLLWKILEPVRFTSAQVEEALELIDSASGRFIQSSDARLWKDRDHLILEFGTDTEELADIQIREAPFEILIPIYLKGEWCDNADMDFSSAPNTVFLDMEKWSWPLIIRSWKKGDRFRPFGMTGQKKISDLLIQQKMSISDKKRVFVLCAEDQILWVIGLRVSEETRIEKSSGQILKLTFAHLDK